MEELLNKLAMRYQQNDFDYQDLVRSLATGPKKLDVERIEAVLQKAGKTPEDLKAAVALHSKRLQLRATFDQSKILLRQKEKIAAEIRKQDEVLSKAQTAYDEAVLPLLAQLDEIRRALDLAFSAKMELRQTYDNPQTANQLKQNRVEIDRLVARRGELDNQLERQQAEAVDLAAHLARLEQMEVRAADQNKLELEVAELSARKLRLQSAISKADGERKKVAADIAQLIAEEERLMDMAIEV